MALGSSKPGPSGLKKWKYNLCDGDEEDISAMVTEKIDIHTDDETDLKI
jgi:hypothetical protein